MINKLVATVTTVMVVLLTVSCTSAREPEIVKQTLLPTLQQNQYIKVSLSGVMTFEFNGEQVAWPTLLATSSIPVTWMGQVFNGTVELNGLTDQVHGAVSSDGEWLLTLSYSRGIIRPSDVIFYSVILKNVPITRMADGTLVVGSFEKQGDVQKFVENVVYRAGGALGNATISSTNYAMTDWSGTTQGIQPVLKVTFEQQPSELIGPGAAPGGM